MIKYYCDKCKKELADWISKEEMVNIQFRGGYGSIFGDGTKSIVHMCQECAYKMFEDAGVLEVGIKEDINDF